MFPPARPHFSGLQYGCRHFAAAERTRMQLQQKTQVIDARAVAVEMTMLMVYALLTGVAVAVLIAVPVVWLSIAAS